ncbi:hypothetical protein J3R30DRAFT_3708599 [Lentinula aciculospora]|uniref:WD40 repeat-like protein n=1 Tax=Lentinula aciculospora TaxID=153920 RepID=A0A9W9A3A6_9AGAR|nr:hypothetical protein J3R30DRAFT_3708599 [Lentinula aciculospora]
MSSYPNSSIRGPSLLSVRKPSSTNADADLEDGTNFRKSLQINMKGLVGDAVGNMSISPWSRDVVLAARRGLFIIDLEAPFEVPRFLPQGGTWDVADVQWNPHPSRAEYIVSTSSEKLLIWNLYMSGKTSIQHILHSHYRAITDINWHTTERDIVVSTGIDSWVWAWDMREPRKPIFGLCAFSSPGTQVKWNRQDSHILASSHADKVLIWDRRKGSLPVTTIDAHTSRIYGIDWSQTQPTEIVTCSLDKTIKVWDSKTMSMKTIIRTAYPVWRARSLPFGRGILSLAQRGETALEMFSLENQGLDGAHELPVDSFQGHSDVVKEFVWRKGANNTVFQLITWSKDRTLRFWPVDSDMMQKVGYSRPSTGYNTHQQEQATASASTSAESAHRTTSFRDATFSDPSPNLVNSDHNLNPNTISAPIGHRSILAEVRAGGPLNPANQTQPRNRQRTNDNFNLAFHTGSTPPPQSPDVFGSVTPTQTQNALNAPVSIDIHNLLGTVPDSFSSLGLSASVSVAGLSGGGTMSRGAAGGLKSRARVDALSWLSSVRDSSNMNSAIIGTGIVTGGDDGNNNETDAEDKRRSASRNGSDSRDSRPGDEAIGLPVGPSLQDEITTVLSKLPASKVRLEKHDLSLTNSNKKQHRTLTLGLQVPWARSESGLRHHSTGLGGPGATYAYSTQSVFLRVTFTFPREYPYSSSNSAETHSGLPLGHPLATTATPTVNMEYTPLITMKDRAFMLRRLRRIIATLRERQRPCLEACLRFLVFKDESSVDFVEGGIAGPARRPGSKTKPSADTREDVDDSDSSEEDIEHISEMGNHAGRDDEVTMSMLRNNKNLAEPRTCQGSFGPNGELVCFFRAPPRIVRNTINTIISHSRSPARKGVEKGNQTTFDRDSLDINNGDDSNEQSHADREAFHQSPALVSDAIRRLALAARDHDSAKGPGFSGLSTTPLTIDTSFMTPKSGIVGQGDMYSAIPHSYPYLNPSLHSTHAHSSPAQVQAQITRIMTNLLTFPRHRGRRQSNSFRSSVELGSTGEGAPGGSEEDIGTTNRSYSALGLVAGSPRRSEVVIINTTSLVGGDKSVAEDYIFLPTAYSEDTNAIDDGYRTFEEKPGNLVQMCDSNAAAARSHGRYDHERIFRSIGAVLATTALGTGEDSKPLASCLGLVKQLFDRLLVDLRAQKDAQMLAMTSSIALQIFYIPKVWHTMLTASSHSTSISTRPGSVLDYFSAIHNHGYISKTSTDSSNSPTHPTRSPISSARGSARQPSSPTLNSGPFSTSSRGSWSSLFSNGRNLMLNAPQLTSHDATVTSKPLSSVQSPPFNSPSRIAVPVNKSTNINHNRPSSGGRALQLQQGRWPSESPSQTTWQIRYQGSTSPHVTPPHTASKSWNEPLAKPKEAALSFSSTGHVHRRTFSQVASAANGSGKKQVIVFEDVPQEDLNPPAYSEEDLALLFGHVHFYAEMLFRWELHHKRAEFLKSITIAGDESTLREFDFGLRFGTDMYELHDAPSHWKARYIM